MRTVISIFFIAHQVSILCHIKKFIFDMIRISLPYLHIMKYSPLVKLRIMQIPTGISRWGAFTHYTIYTPPV